MLKVSQCCSATWVPPRTHISWAKFKTWTKKEGLPQKGPMLFTWEVVFEAYVLRLLVSKVIDASAAKLLYLSEQPWRKASTLGCVAGSEALYCILCSLIRASVNIVFSPQEVRSWLWGNGAGGADTADECVWSWGQSGTWQVPLHWLKT